MKIMINDKDNEEFQSVYGSGGGRDRQSVKSPFVGIAVIALTSILTGAAIAIRHNQPIKPSSQAVEQTESAHSRDADFNEGTRNKLQIQAMINLDPEKVRQIVKNPRTPANYRFIEIIKRLDLTIPDRPMSTEEAVKPLMQNLHPDWSEAQVEAQILANIQRSKDEVLAEKQGANNQSEEDLDLEIRKSKIKLQERLAEIEDAKRSRQIAFDNSNVDPLNYGAIATFDFQNKQIYLQEKQAALRSAMQENQEALKTPKMAKAIKALQDANLLPENLAHTTDEQLAYIKNMQTKNKLSIK